MLVAQSWGDKGPQSIQAQNLALSGSKKQLNLPPGSPRSSDQLSDQVSFVAWFWKSMSRLILGKHLLRLKISMLDFHYKCREFKNENTKVSFHDLKNLKSQKIAYRLCCCCNWGGNAKFPYETMS